MRRSDLVEEPVLFLDDDGHDLPPTIEIRPGRGFRKEWLLLVAALAVVIGVGLIGDGSGHEPAAAATTTTSAVPTTVHRRFSGTARRFPTSTTTSLAAGPVAPFPTGTAIVYMDRSGAVNILDLDTGDECTVDDPQHRGLWLSQGPSTIAFDRAPVQGAGGSVLVDSSCSTYDVGGAPGSTPIAIGDMSFWTWVQETSSAPLVEHDLRTGELTGRTVDVQPGIGPTVVAAGHRLVVGLAGQMTEVTPRGALRDLGPGVPVALHGGSLASVRCERLRCRLRLADLDFGTSRTLTPEWLAMVPWTTTTFSLDGSLLLAQALQPGEEQPNVVLINLVTGYVRVLPAEYSQAVFTVDGAHLIASQGSELVLLSIDGTESWPIQVHSQPVGVLAMPGRASY